MIDIAKHISELVRVNELVIVPGLGGFLTNFHPAIVNAVSKKIEAPGRHIAFNSQLKENDGFLTHSFAQANDLNYKDALQLIETFVVFCKDEIKSGGSVNFEDLGILTNSISGHLTFKSDLSVNYDDRFFGLPEIEASPIVRRQKYEPVIQIHPQTKEKIRKNAPIYRRIAAIALPIAFIGITAWFAKDPIKSVYQQSASIINLDSNTQPIKNNTKTIEAEELNTITESEAIIEEAMNESSEIIVQEKIKSFNGKYHIISGAFTNKDLAEKLILELEAEGFDAYMAGQSRSGLYRVSAGNFIGSDKAIKQLRWFQSNKNNHAWLLNEEL